MNQTEYFQSNQVGGQLSDLQMAQMLNLPEGDTTAVETSVPGADVVTETPETDAGTKDEAVVEPVVLAKDGVHTIPFAKLEEARHGEQHWRSVATEQQRKIDELSQQKPAVEPAVMVDADMDAKEQEYIDALMDGDADKAKAIRREINTELARQNDAKINAVLEPIQKQREISATDAHFNAIAKVHPDYESIGQSQELATWIAKQPSFVRSGYEKVIAEGTAEQAIELFDAFKSANGKLNVAGGRPNATEIAKTVIASAKSKPPSSLSEIPAGSGVQHDEAAAMMEMSVSGLMSKFEGKTPEQINALLSRVI